MTTMKRLLRTLISSEAMCIYFLLELMIPYILYANGVHP
jgi:hypothetical protein